MRICDYCGKESNDEYELDLGYFLDNGEGGGTTITSIRDMHSKCCMKLIGESKKAIKELIKENVRKTKSEGRKR